MAGLSNASLARIDSALKRANTRIARLEDTFGRSSSTFKNQISLFEKGALHKYTGESASGHWKFDKGKIMKDIRSGKLNFDQANEILRNAAGIQIDSSGDVVDSKYSGIQTVSDVLKDTVSTIQSGSVDLSKYQDENGFIEINKTILKEITEELNIIAESFQTEYEESPLDDQTMQNDPILKNLYSENRGKRPLTYNELKDISERLRLLREDFDNSRLQGKQNNDFLSNKQED